MTLCPVDPAHGELVAGSFFDEDVEGWVCDECGFSVLGDWSEPPKPEDLGADWAGVSVEEYRRHA